MYRIALKLDYIFYRKEISQIFRKLCLNLYSSIFVIKTQIFFSSIPLKLSITQHKLNVLKSV